MIYTPIFDAICDCAFMGDPTLIDKLSDEDVVSLMEEAKLRKAAVYRQLRGHHDNSDALDSKTLFKHLTSSNTIQNYISRTRGLA